MLKYNILDYEDIDEWSRSIAEGGEVRAIVRAILTILSDRGIAVSDQVRARIRGTHDLALLDKYLHRAIVAKGPEDLAI